MQYGRAQLQKTIVKLSIGRKLKAVRNGIGAQNPCLEHNVYIKDFLIVNFANHIVNHENM